jgi:hypothetical protein
LSSVEEAVGSLRVDGLPETCGLLADLAEIIEFTDGRGEERMAGRPKIRLRYLVRHVFDGTFLEAQIFPKMEGFSLRRIGHSSLHYPALKILQSKTQFWFMMLSPTTKLSLYSPCQNHRHNKAALFWECWPTTIKELFVAEYIIST